MRIYDEIISKVSNELNLKESYVKYVLNHIFRTTSKFIQNPQNYFYSSLTLESWFYFKIVKDKVKLSILKLEITAKAKGVIINNIEYYKSILKKLNNE